MLTYLLLLAATVCWGIWGFANKLAVDRAHPFEVQWMYSIPLALLIPLWFVLGRSQTGTTDLDGGALLWAVVSGLAAAAGFSLTLFAMRETSATAVVALTSAYPIVTAALAFLAGRERLAPGQMLAIAMIVTGVILFELLAPPRPS